MLCLQDWYNLWRPLANSFSGSTEEKIQQYCSNIQRTAYKIPTIDTDILKFKECEEQIHISEALIYCL